MKSLKEKFIAFVSNNTLSSLEFCEKLNISPHKTQKIIVMIEKITT